MAWPKGVPRSESTRRDISRALKARIANLKRSGELLETARAKLTAVVGAKNDGSLRAVLALLNKALDLLGAPRVEPSPGAGQDELVSDVETAVGRLHAGLLMEPADADRERLEAELRDLEARKVEIIRELVRASE